MSFFQFEMLMAKIIKWNTYIQSGLCRSVEQNFNEVLLKYESYEG